jgi:hypothetical protein
MCYDIVFNKDDYEYKRVVGINYERACCINVGAHSIKIIVKNNCAQLRNLTYQTQDLS